MPLNNLRSEDKTVYVLHQLEAEKHYEGLKYYCNSNGYVFKFRLFSIKFLLLSGLKHLNRNKRLSRGISDFCFLLKLPFLKRKNIVLGIAPYDYRMVFFNLLSKRHNLFYHTSWPYWDQSNFPERKFHSMFGKRILKSWRCFLEENCKGIFCVSGYTETQLKINYKVSCPTVVVYHSIDSNLFHPAKQLNANSPLKFLFVGRIVESKGIYELTNLADDMKNEGFSIGMAGDGVLAKDLKQIVENKTNVVFYGQVKRADLAEMYRTHDFLLCPSKKGTGWEELFGISIIEAMACGCVPVATNHVGPREIIKSAVDGFLIEDENIYNNLYKQVSYLMQLDGSVIGDLKKNTIEKGQQFYTAEIAGRWAKTMSNFI
jgi:glycosyltransferase involved in cell wall biosynthesis